jgi:hypothetical protein
VAADFLGRSRRAGGVFLRTLWRVTRQVFHEATGALFAVFALAGAISAWRAWHRGEREWMVWLPVGFVVMMGLFAVASFRSARRVR